MSDNVVIICYIIAAILFILSLGGLSNQESARRGNWFGIIGMLLALVAVTASKEVTAYGLLAISIFPAVVIGGFAVNKMETWNFVDKSDEESDKILSEFSEIPSNVYGFGHKKFLENVIECINFGKKALVDGIEGRKSLELINAIYESAETGKEIFLKYSPRKSKLGKKNES